MTAIDCILDGLETELDLELELGVRSVEIDRSLLAPMAAEVRPATGDGRRAATLSDAKPTPNDAKGPCSFVFLHDRPLSQGGVEMMAKVVLAMHQTPETAPIVFTGDKPPARLYVVLGLEAMKKWYPGLRGAPGQWLRGRNGEDVLVTYSPEHILRFGVVTPAVKKMKVDMWASLKGVMQRMEQFAEKGM